MNTLVTKNFNYQYPQKSLEQYQVLRESMFHPKSDSEFLSKNLGDLQQTYSYIDENTIKKIFRENLDEIVIMIKKIEVKTTFHVLFAVTTNRSTYVLKVNIIERYRDFSFFQEAKIQKLLEEKKLPFLTVYAVDISRSIYPFDFMIMAYEKGDNLDFYNGQEIKNIYKNLGKIFKKIHTITADKAGTLNFTELVQRNTLIGSFNSWNEFFTTQLLSHIQQTREIGIIDKKDADLIQIVFKNSKQVLATQNLSLLHNDPGTRNIKTFGGVISAIFDWEDSIFGDQLWEIAFIDTFLFREEDSQKFLYFCKGYGIEVSTLYALPKYWMYYLRVSLLKTISRSKVGYYNTIGREIDKKRVEKSLAMLQKVL